MEIYSDSWLVVSRVKGSFEAKDSRMVEYLRLVGQMMGKFQKAKVVQISWGQNRHADSLATLASFLDNEIPRLITVEMLHEPSIDPQVGISVISVLGFNWMDPIIENLPEVRLSSESKEADKVRRVAA